MNWIAYNQTILTEQTVSLEFSDSHEVVAKYIDYIWRFVHPDFENDSIPQDNEELKKYISNIALKNKEKALLIAHEEIVNERKSLINLPVVVLSKNKIHIELQNKIKKNLPFFQNSNLYDSLINEDKIIKGIEIQLSKITNYSKLFSNVVQCLNPKATRNVFEINVQKFLKELSVAHLISLPESPTMDNISKAFFKQERSSVGEIISHLS